MIRPVLPWPHATLAEKSLPVVTFDDHIAQLCRDLAETAAAADAPMMSAIQIGARAQIIYLSNRLAGQPVMLINPVVESRSEILQHQREACASVPGITIDMWRSASLTIAARNPRGDELAFRADGILAQAIQHELAHLDGKSIIDQGKRAKRWFYRERLKKYGGARGDVLDYRNMRAAG